MNGCQGHRRARARLRACGVLAKGGARRCVQARDAGVSGYVSSGYACSRVSCLFKAQAYYPHVVLVGHG